MRLKHEIPAILIMAGLCSNAQAGQQAFNYDALGRLVFAGSSEGNFTRYGYDSAGNRVLKNSYVPSQAMRAWEAAALPHAIGALDNDGWAVTIADTPNYISFGPYVSDIPTGDHVGIWKMMVDNNTNDNFDIVRIDVNDATAGQIIATRTVKRSEWTAAHAYEYFYLPWTLEQIPIRLHHNLRRRTCSCILAV